MTNVARLLRGLLPLLAASAAAMAPALPATAAVSAVAPQAVTRADQWWLTALRAPAALRAVPEAGKGVTVAVLSTGVDASHQDLAGSVTTGPDLSKTGRAPSGPYWGAEGTAVASLIAGHGHGPGGSEGITGIAPGARILSLQVTLEYDDPLNSDAAVTRGLPAAITAGIRYAVGHGATVIALPLDPGVLDAAPLGDPAAGGSAAERAAVSFALAHNVVLVAPAGDNGARSNSVNYPAAYPGVIAVGATSRDGQLAPFTSTRPYVSLTAPGSGITPDPATSSGMTSNPAAGLMVAAPDGGYEPLASSDMSAALTAGVAALIRSRYPWLTAAEVGQALEHGVNPPAGSAGPAPAGWGHGGLDAAAAVDFAAGIAAAHPAPAASAPPSSAAASRPATVPARAHQAAGRSDPGHLLRSLVVDLAVAACVLIACLVAAITLTRLRRRARAAKSAGVAAVSRHGHAAGHARHARGQPGTDTRPVPARVVIWPSTPALPASGTSDSPPTPGTLGRPAGVAYRRPRPAGNPPWQPAAPPRSPTALPEMLPAQPALEAAGQPLPPWERSPADFATAPAVDEVAPWPVSTTGPMYVWNPAATGPIVAADGDEESD